MCLFVLSMCWKEKNKRNDERQTRDRKEKANHTEKNGEKHDWILCRVQLNEIDMI